VIKVNKIKQKDLEIAMERASDVFGVDPSYFGEEGKQEVDKQLLKLGYKKEDLVKGNVEE